MIIEYPPRKTTDDVHLADLASCEQLAHVIKYNLALCYHLKYIAASTTADNDDDDEEEEVRESYLNSALRLYENVQELVMEQLDDGDDAAAATTTTRTTEAAAASWWLLQHMAVATNLGHIYYTRKEQTKGDWSMQIVLSTLLQCTTSTTTQEEEEVFFGHTTTNSTTTTTQHGRSSSSRVLAGFFKLLLPPPPARAA